MDSVETFLTDVQETHDSGAAVPETSYYPALRQLLNDAGHELAPKVRCVVNLRNRGAGIPDGGLFSAEQLRGRAEDDSALGALPSRGAIEVKPPSEDVDAIADSVQVRRYLAEYGQVLVTNLREFLLVVTDDNGEPRPLERYKVAASEREFWTAARAWRKTAGEQGERLLDFLRRVIQQSVPLTRPRDVAWFLASYAREARGRLEATDLGELRGIRQALEESLGITFTGERGDHFFRSTLVQTLFYGVFSAWVLWSKRHPAASSQARFNWHEAGWFSNVPVIAALFEQISTPRLMRELELVEVLDWAGMALNRVDRAAFFAVFEEGNEAVQYFYEPFLEAFDPELRKELGVWYTPNEVVRYMVSRVDTVLREELDIANGLADERVVVLDPACGTGSYLVEVLRQIAARLQRRGDALWAHDLKRAATERIIGFEILPAPFVVSHLQIGLLLENLGAPLTTNDRHDNDHERAAVYLTNSLTGWGEHEPHRQSAFLPEMDAERDAANHVKRDTPVLVVLGNPPYNGFPGTAIGDEKVLTDAYRMSRNTRQSQGQGLNELYVRFFRMAERQIVDQTGKGIICFISNSSWLSRLCHPAMRERYLDVFDHIWIDNLNGDSRETGKVTPWGDPDPSIFSTERNREGIQVGTAIALLVRDEQHVPASGVRYRDLWGRNKAAGLKPSLELDGNDLYQEIMPQTELGLPFRPVQADAQYLTWPLLSELFPTSFPGINTSRDEGLVDVDRERLVEEMQQYFDPTLDDQYIARLMPSLMQKSRRFDPESTRAFLVRRGFIAENVVRYLYRPFDIRWIYWEPETKLLDEKRAELWRLVAAGEDLLICRPLAERQREGTPFIVANALIDRHLTRPGSAGFPVLLNPDSPRQSSLFATNMSGDDNTEINASPALMLYLSSIDSRNTIQRNDLAVIRHHVLAIGYSSNYLSANDGALRYDWPRIPLPDSADLLAASAKLGEQVAALLDPLQPVDEVTQGDVRAELAAIGSVTRVGGGTLSEGDDLAVTARWGIRGRGGITMPSRGKTIERDYTAEERAALLDGAAALGLAPEAMIACLGETTYDVYLNDRAYWCNVPVRVWDYTIGGYQVIKKWLSYRERDLLGRPLSPAEVREVMHIARRIAAILLLEPALDANYLAVKANTYDWRGAGKGR